MPSHIGARPIKAWRYVGVFSDEVMVCAASVRVGPARQSFWAVWDRAGGRLHERTIRGRAGVSLSRGCVRIREPEIQVELELQEAAGIETICRYGRAYGWTRKQGGVPASGVVMLGGSPRALAGRAVIDDTAAYYPRHTRWLWSAGVGFAADGREVAWNLVDGVNDPSSGSERTVWVAGAPAEAPPSRFAADLSGVDGLRFSAGAVRSRRENRLLVRSVYRQPFGTFAGTLPGGLELAIGYGVMEEHDVYW
jgi:hypothetical protein